MHLDNTNIGLRWSEQYAQVAANGFEQRLVDYAFTCEAEDVIWKYVDGDKLLLNDDSGIRAMIGISDDPRGRMVFNAESSSSFAPYDACTYDKDCAAINYDVRSTVQQQSPIELVQWVSYGSYLQLDSRTDDYQTVFKQVDSQINQKLCQARKVIRIVNNVKRSILLTFYDFSWLFMTPYDLL